MELVIPRSDEKRGAHLEELISLATQDIERGEEVLPRVLYDRLVAVQQTFGMKYQWLSRKSGEKAQAIVLRNKTNKRLSHLVRDIFIMARRKYDRGDINGEAISLHCIPKGTVHAKGQANFWISYAGQILAGDTAWTRKNQTILLDPSRPILEVAQAQARVALNEANRVIAEVSKLQTQMQQIRQEVNHLLSQARQYLVAAHFGLEPAKLREVLFAYGYRFRPARRKPMGEDQTLQPKTPTKAGTRTKIVPKESAFTYSAPAKEPTTPKATATPKPPTPTPPEPTAPKATVTHKPPTPPEPTIPVAPTALKESVSPKPEDQAVPTNPKAAAPTQSLAPQTLAPTVPQDPEFKAAITIEKPITNKGVQAKLDKIKADAAKREANAQARYGSNKPKRKKRPKKGK